MCKGNYALSVKESKRWIQLLGFTDCNTLETRAEIGLDDFLCENIIIFTHRRAPLSSKTASASPGRGAEPESRRRHERTISAERVLRSRRFGSSQVRDAAASGTRGTAGERSCPSLWLFQAFVLSGTSRFRRAGLVGLLPHKRGPRGGHKLTAEVMDFVIRTREQDACLSWEEIGGLIQQRFPISIHPRSIARQWRRQKKRS